MKVLHIITSLRIGGAERLVTQLIPRFRRAGIETELAVFDATQTDFLSQIETEGITIHKFGMGYSSMYNPLHILRLRELVSRFDIIHAHNSSCQLFTAIACAKNIDRPRTVTTEHNTRNRRRKWNWYKAVDRWMYGCYDAIVCCSHATQKELNNSLAGHSLRIQVINNGVDIENINKSKPSFSLKKPAAVMVAAFRPQKDHRTAIEAIKRLPDVHLYFAGNGSTRNEAEKYVNRNGIGNHVHFLGSVDDIGGLYKSADCAILCSNYEGFGLSAVEAMAAGTPLIATDVPGLGDIAREAAILVPPKDPEALAKSISDLLSTPPLRSSLISAGLDRAAQFSIESTAKQYINLYNNLIFT